MPQVSAFGFQANSPVGSRIKAVCSASEEAKLSWLKDGIRMLNKKNGVSLEERGDLLVLIINNVRPNHSGNYTCMAKNSFGESSYSAVLTVAAGPDWLTVPKDQTVATGSSVELLCQADGFPPPQILWTTNEGMINNRRCLQISPSDG